MKTEVGCSGENNNNNKKQCKLQTLFLPLSQDAQKKFQCKLVQIILEPKAELPAKKLPMRQHLGSRRPAFIRFSCGYKSANPVVIPPSARNSWATESRACTGRKNRRDLRPSSE